MTTAGHIAKAMRDIDDEVDRNDWVTAVIDVPGVGGGVVDRLIELRLPVTPYNGGEGQSTRSDSSMLELRTTGHCGNCSFGPWMSDNNIDGGARWNDKIAKALEETDFGIVCVTRENQSSAWLNFEAGAVAKKVGQARVIPLLIDLPPADLKGPLPAFQWRLLNEKDLRLLVHDVNNAAEQQVTEKTLDRLFDATWQELGTALTPRSTALRQLRRRRRENLMTCWPRSWRPYGGSSATWTAT